MRVTFSPIIAILACFGCASHSFHVGSNAKARTDVSPMSEYDDVLYAALVDRPRNSPPYCLTVLGKQPSGSLKKRLTSHGHVLQCKSELKNFIAIQSIETTKDGFIRLSILSDCDDHLCASQGWTYIRHNGVTYVFDHYEVEWIE